MSTIVTLIRKHQLYLYILMPLYFVYIIKKRSWIYDIKHSVYDVLSMSLKVPTYTSSSFSAELRYMLTFLLIFFKNLKRFES